MKLHGGTIVVDNKELKDVVLWRDTAPHEMTIVCKSDRRAELRVWNCWRDDRGTIQAWVGNSGMSVQPGDDGNRMTIECNSQPTVTFEDLVFELAFEGP
jgi:hypothetical protein